MESKNIIGVKTTKIYCLPSCPAGAPVPQNIIHFNSVLEAERNGFRPCKRCFPDFPYGSWIDDGVSVLLKTPPEFEFSQCLKFLARSPLEPCHRVENNALFKLEKIAGKTILMKVSSQNKRTLTIDFLTSRPKKSVRALAAKYIWQWFDLEKDLRPFYRMAAKDPVLKNVTKNLYGLRMMTIIDLFEAICWAIIGQQINLTFAYTLKKRFVESFGETYSFNNKRYYLFPTPKIIAQQTVADLKRLQFTGKKSEYIIELAKIIISGKLTKRRLLNQDGFETARKELMRLHGVGQWTADYVSLRCLKDPAAFPVGDAGLQNAVKQQLGLSTKPTVDDLAKISEHWQNWKAYATFYLWASLI